MSDDAIPGNITAVTDAQGRPWRRLESDIWMCEGGGIMEYESLPEYMMVSKHGPVSHPE